jgi:Ca2+-binding RTX toxin-like protein
VGGIGFIGCDALDADGVARINGLSAIVPASIRTVDPAGTIAAAVTNYCGLEGPIWGEGNILLGGAGSDTLEGRGADDILDGDRYLNVRLSVRTTPASPATEYGSTGLMENAAVTGYFGPGTEGMNLQQAVFAGKVNPGNIVAVREILTPPAVPADCGVAAPLNCDTAVFSGPEAEYTLTANVGDLVGSLKVTDLADPANAAPIAPAVPGRATDGINDTLWNRASVPRLVSLGVLVT